MADHAGTFSDAQVLQIEKEIFGKPIPPELRKRVEEIYNAGVSRNVFLSPKEFQRRVEAVDRLLEEHGFGSPPKSKKTRPVRRLLKALHLA